VGWSPDVVIVFWGGSPFFSGPLPRNFKQIIKNLSSNPVDWHPLCGQFQKSEAHALGAGRGVSQANEAAINPKLTGLCQHEIVIEI
jgi:hypothetical protein